MATSPIAAVTTPAAPVEPVELKREVAAITTQSGTSPVKKAEEQSSTPAVKTLFEEAVSANLPEGLKDPKTLTTRMVSFLKANGETTTLGKIGRFLLVTLVALSCLLIVPGIVMLGFVLFGDGVTTRQRAKSALVREEMMKAVDENATKEERASAKKTAEGNAEKILNDTVAHYNDLRKAANPTKEAAPAPTAEAAPAANPTNEAPTAEAVATN